MRYSEHVDYLIAAIGYLGTNEHWWARSAEELGQELSLDSRRLAQVFQGFPGLFRKSHGTGEGGRRFYSLQMRYSHREGGGVSEPGKVSEIAPLSVEQMRMLFDFVLHAAASEATGRRAAIASGVAVVAASIAAIASITAAVLSA